MARGDWTRQLQKVVQSNIHSDNRSPEEKQTNRGLAVKVQRQIDKRNRK